MTEVRTAHAGDADEVGRVLANGFEADPVMSWVFEAPGRDRKLRAFFGFLAHEALVPLGATYVLPGSCAAWTPPGTADWPDERGQRFGEVLAETCSPGDVERLGILDAATRACHPPGSHWFLSVVATERSAQGRGLASTILRASLVPVDAAGLPAYLESTNPRNVPLYERHGFVVTGEVRLPDGPSLTTMWRDAATS